MQRKFSNHQNDGVAAVEFTILFPVIFFFVVMTSEVVYYAYNIHRILGITTDSFAKYHEGDQLAFDSYFSERIIELPSTVQSSIQYEISYDDASKSSTIQINFFPEFFTPWLDDWLQEFEIIASSHLYNN